MVVGFFHPHNEGVVAGIITGPGFDTDTMLVDTYEVDASIKSFETEADAEAWVDGKLAEIDVIPDLLPVMGGRVHQEAF